MAPYSFADEYDNAGQAAPSNGFAGEYDQAQPGGDPNDPPKGLSNQQKSTWNKFIDFVGSEGKTNDPSLNMRDKSVGLDLLKKFNAANPKEALSPDIISQVQQEIQNHRQEVINAWKKDPSVMATPVKSEAEIMPNISKVDGWPGTATLSHKFPVAKANLNGQNKDYGVDYDAYNKAIGNKK